MRRSLSLLPILLICLLCSGCVQFATLVELNLDGSGRVLIRYLVTKNTGVSLFGGADKEPEFPEKMQEYEKLLPEAAKKMGKGVTFVESSRFDDKGWVGVTATFDFEDVNDLVLTGNPADEEEDQDKDEDATEKQDPPFDAIKFSFVDGEVKTLTVTLEKAEVEEIDEKEKDPFLQAGLKLHNASSQKNSIVPPSLFKSALRSVRVSALVKVEGEVIESNAAKMNNANSAVIFDVDFSKFDEATLDRVCQGMPLSETLEKKTPGFTVNPPSTPTKIKFRAKK